jgi:hypothetical protein
MSTYSYLFAFALLTTPPDVLELPEAARLHAPLAPTMRAMALHWELLDPREVGYVLSQSDDFAGDLKLLQGRVQDLGDAPAVAECTRFPTREMAGDLLAFNRAYRDGLTNRLTLDRRQALQELRDLVGARAFYSGQLPPHVPLWRIPTVD